MVRSETSVAARAPVGTGAEPLFVVRDLSKVYRTGEDGDELQVQALRGVNLEVGAGEFVVLLGASGSGKSTLLNILGGLEVASSGSVRYAGTELTTLDEEALTRYRRVNVGFVFQSTS